MIGRPVVVAEPTAAVTFKLPPSLVDAVRARACGDSRPRSFRACGECRMKVLSCLILTLSNRSQAPYRSSQYAPLITIPAAATIPARMT
jgi:hypothetical protein